MKHLYLLLLACAMVACSPKVTPAQDAATASSKKALRSVIVYQTRGDYADLVPITLDEAGKTVVSYPAPTDINPGQRPIALGDGWYLDRRGINANSAFTTYTYSDYAALEQAPTAEELLSHLTDAKGVTAIYDCGKKKLTVDQLKDLVKNNFPGCVRVK